MVRATDQGFQRGTQTLTAGPNEDLRFAEFGFGIDATLLSRG